MIKANDLVNENVKTINNKDVLDKLSKSFMIACQNEDFSKLCNTLKLDKDVLKKYTSKLEMSVNEINNCKNCPGLNMCKNEVKGYVYFPKKEKDYLVFSYQACKYKKDYDKNKGDVTYYETSKLLREARMKNIYLDDKARVEVIILIKKEFTCMVVLEVGKVIF